MQAPSPRSKIRRAERGSYDRQEIYEILDEALVAHVGFELDRQPFVIPMVYGRIGDTLYLHGSTATRIMRTLAQQPPVSLAVTLLDGLVLARSAFHHSVNYRSVVLLGTVRAVHDAEERLNALRAIVEHAVPERWASVRGPTTKELARTAVFGFQIAEASAKRRAGPPVDAEEDYALPVWAGEIPLRQVADKPVADPRLGPGMTPPEHALAYSRTRP